MFSKTEEMQARDYLNKYNSRPPYDKEAVDKYALEAEIFHKFKVPVNILQLQIDAIDKKEAMQNTEDPIFQMADDITRLKAEKEQLKARLTEVNKELVDTQYVMASLMIDKEMSKFNRKGVTFYVTSDYHPSILADYKTVAYDAIRENGFGDIIQPFIHPSTFKAFCKGFYDKTDELPEWLAPYVNAYETLEVGTRKSG